MAFGFINPYQPHLGSIAQRAAVVGQPAPLPAPQDPMKVAGPGGAFPTLPGSAAPAAAPAPTAPPAAAPAMAPAISAGGAGPATATAGADAGAAAGAGDIADLIAAIFGG